MASTITASPRMPGWGEPMPPLTAPRLGGVRDMENGSRVTLILFFGTGAHPATAAALQLATAQTSLFDDVGACFYGVTIDSSDEAQARITARSRGIRFILDYDRAISLGFDVLKRDGMLTPCWVLLDRTRRVLAIFPVEEGEAAIAATRAEAAQPGGPDWAPVAMVPNIFEPAFCRTLIEHHIASDHRPSGVMRQVDGKARLVLDNATKVRRDVDLERSPLTDQILARLVQRLAPMIRRVFQYDMLHIERLCLACYDAAEGGHFLAHRDDATRATAHRQFAITVNLNAEEYDGGDLIFPEFGTRQYRVPTGGAIVFSCALMHAVVPVTRGRRYALLPFLYDAAGDRLREENERFVDRNPLDLNQPVVATA